MGEERKKVLVIEDQQNFMVMISASIEDLGMESVDDRVVNSVAEAMEKIKFCSSANVILLDMNLTGFHDDESSDGYQIVKKLRETATLEIIKKIVCISSVAQIFKPLLIPLGVVHFGGKDKFADCLMGTCNCMGATEED